MIYKRITLLCGHYGSGKTNIAVNMAYDLKKNYEKVVIADLDIVNPYFRTKDSAGEFEDLGIRLVCSEYAGSNVDIPAMPQQMYSLTDDKDQMVIIDVGGDDRGALALGRIAPSIIEENDYEMIFVINCYRPLTRDAESTIEVMKEIEDAAKIKFTAIVNNSNLGEETKREDVLKSLAYAEEISQKTGLPIKCTSVYNKLYDDLKNEIPNLFSLNLQDKIN
jgi:CO dehydrogenase nickel-insertion accessory protein CooC1